MDGHESHNSSQFRDFCSKHNIITLCMPPHSSHLLQPLDVGCFAPLKRAYSRQIEELVRCHINHITKEDFLPAFKKAFDKAIIPDNIIGAFRGTGLIPFNPAAVIDKLDVRIRTPTPEFHDAEPETPQWASQTPRNAIEVGSQSEYMRQRIQRHQDSSPSSIIASFNSLAKGVSMIAHGASIMEVEIGRLRRANDILTARKKRKKRVIRGSNSRSVAEGLALIARQAVSDQNDAAIAVTAPRQRRCGRCRQPGHRIETCRMPPLVTPENAVSSNTFN